jgi:hypothetical protein
LKEDPESFMHDTQTESWLTFRNHGVSKSSFETIYLSNTFIEYSRLVLKQEYFNLKTSALRDNERFDEKHRRLSFMS